MTRRVFHTIILLLALAITSVCASRYFTSKKTFYGDAFGYYVYLPSAFIYHDLRTPFDAARNDRMTWEARWSLDEIAKQKKDNGYFLNQYTYGVALMESPFFFTARIYEHIKGDPPNGYSDTYDLLIKISGLLYSLLGLWLVYRILLKYFDSTIALVTTSLVFLCTNLFWFTVFQSGMSHGPLFFLYALLIVVTIRLYEGPSAKWFMTAGFIAGLITLIRPTDILCLLIPLLYDVDGKAAFRLRIAFLVDNKRSIALAAIVFIAPIIPQLFYWKAVTGHYVCYSYGDQSFTWLRPKIIQGLFFFSNGWLPYSPVMIFSLLGLLLHRSFRKWAWCIFLLFPLYCYVIYSWYCYYYLNGLGSRPMIHLYPLMAIPLAACIRYISSKGMIAETVFAALCLLFLAVNLCFSVQELTGVLDSAESNMAFNYQMLFRDKLEYKDLIVKDVGEIQPDINKLTRLRVLHRERYEDSSSVKHVTDPTGASKYMYHMRDTNYMEIAVIRYDPETFKGAKWFRCSGRFMYTKAPNYYRHLLILDINNKWKLWRGCNIENKIFDGPITPDTKMSFDRTCLNTWGEVSYFAKVPWYLTRGDVIKLAVWITDKRDIYMDDLCLELYK